MKIPILTHIFQMGWFNHQLSETHVLSTWKTSFVWAKDVHQVRKKILSGQLDRKGVDGPRS